MRATKIELTPGEIGGVRMSSHAAFVGSVPRTYHKYLGPMIFEDYARDMARRLAVKPGQRVLELACGTGIVTKEIVKGMPRDAAVVATDLNQAMIDVARPYVGDDARITYKTADACTLPFGDGEFDAIACQYGVMFFPDKVKSMREARRVLKPGGRYVFNVWDSLEHNPLANVVHETVVAMYPHPEKPPAFLGKTPYAWFDRGEIEKTVRAGGFTKVMIEMVGFPSQAPTAMDAATGFVQGTPVLGMLAEIGVKDPGPATRAAAEALAKKFGEKPCRATMRAVVVRAE